MADFSKLKRRTLGVPPPLAEASTNLEQPEVAPVAAELTSAAEHKPDASIYRRPDGRSLRRSNRVVQFATRVTPEFDQRIRTIAEREGLLIVEVLERALEAYERKMLDDS